VVALVVLHGVQVVAGEASVVAAVLEVGVPAVPGKIAGKQIE
jgi:hypothetical protein